MLDAELHREDAAGTAAQMTTRYSSLVDSISENTFCNMHLYVCFKKKNPMSVTRGPVKHDT